MPLAWFSIFLSLFIFPSKAFHIPFLFFSMLFRYSFTSISLLERYLQGLVFITELSYSFYRCFSARLPFFYFFK